jgi:hypothetical protein
MNARTLDDVSVIYEQEKANIPLIESAKLKEDIKYKANILSNLLNKLNIEILKEDTSEDLLNRIEYGIEDKFKYYKSPENFDFE